MGKPPPPRKALRRQLRELLRASCDIQPTAAGEIPLADLDKALAVTDLVIRPSPRLPGDLEVHSLRLGRLLHLESWMTARPLRGGTPAHPIREMEQGWSLWMPTWPHGNEALERVSLENLADRSLQDAARAPRNDPGSMPEVHSSFMNLMVQLNAL